MSGKWQISRRTVLRGFGTALALPALEAMRPVTALAGPAGSAAHPIRMAFIFVPNGVHLTDWTPQATGHDYDLPFILEPLARVKDDINVMTGLTHDKGRANGDGAGDHARSASVFLTGAQPRKTAGGDIRSGVSVDQVAAQKIGEQTRFPSLQLGCEPGRSAGNCDSGYSCAYTDNISWASPTSPLSKEINPKLIFERLVEGSGKGSAGKARGERDFYRKSLLDFIAEDAQRLQAKLGRADQRKLDEYLTGVREIERRVERASSSGEKELKLDAYPQPTGIPADYGAHMRLMGDMMALAFQADMTRVITCMFARAGSNRSYRPIGVPDGHHTLSHHGGDPKKHAKIRKINQFHVTQLAYFLERLKSIREGEGTLLDNCMVVYGSGLSDGNRHNNEDLPILLAGRGGGTISSGRHVQFERETPVTNLYLSMLERVGAPTDVLGDSTGQLGKLHV